jgi:hypothetical protein
MQVIFAGAATVAALALFTVAPPSGAVTASGSVRLVDQATQLTPPSLAPSGPQTAPSMGGDDTSASGNVVAVDDDTNPSSGDIFTQNAEDQSTASGAGT